MTVQILYFLFHVESCKNSTSRYIYIFKVLICIERCLYSVYFKEINLFENVILGKKVLFFTSQLSCSHPLASLEKKRNTFSNNYLWIFHSETSVYVETLLFGCCINTIFHMNKAELQILWTVIRLSYEVFLLFSQPAVYFEKSPSHMKIDEEHLC